MRQQVDRPLECAKRPKDIVTQCTLDAWGCIVTGQFVDEFQLRYATLPSLLGLFAAHYWFVT